MTPVKDIWIWTDYFHRGLCSFLYFCFIWILWKDFLRVCIYDLVKDEEERTNWKHLGVHQRSHRLTLHINQMRNISLLGMTEQNNPKPNFSTEDLHLLNLRQRKNYVICFVKRTRHWSWISIVRCLCNGAGFSQKRCYHICNM